MVEVRIVLLSLAAAVAKGGGTPALFRVQSPAEDFAVVIYVNRVCLWEAPDGPVPVLDVRLEPLQRLPPALSAASPAHMPQPLPVSQRWVAGPDHAISTGR